MTISGKHDSVSLATFAMKIDEQWECYAGPYLCVTKKRRHVSGGRRIDTCDDGLTRRRPLRAKPCTSYAGKCKL